MGMAMQPNSASQSNLLALPDGTELVGDFRIKRVLGAGGFGITYLAEEMALARLVTIKEYFPADYAARRATTEAVPRSQDCAGDYKWGLERFIEEAHGGNYLHRDIAPDNIMVRKDGSPVLIDFGSARGEIASHTKTVSALVKPGYSPYEQYATTTRQQGPWT